MPLLQHADTRPPVQEEQHMIDFILDAFSVRRIIAYKRQKSHDVEHYNQVAAPAILHNKHWLSLPCTPRQPAYDVGIIATYE